MGSYTDDADNFGPTGQYYSGSEYGLQEALSAILSFFW